LQIHCFFARTCLPRLLLLTFTALTASLLLYANFAPNRYGLYGIPHKGGHLSSLIQVAKF